MSKVVRLRDDAALLWDLVGTDQEIIQLLIHRCDQAYDANARLRRVVDAQIARIDLLERAAAPFGPRGLARVRPAWWRRAWRRLRAAVGL